MKTLHCLHTADKIFTFSEKFRKKPLKSQKQAQGQSPYPFAQVKGGCCQNEVEDITDGPFEIVPRKPEVAFEMANGRFDSTPAAEILSGEFFPLLLFCSASWGLRPLLLGLLHGLTILPCEKVSTSFLSILPLLWF